MITVREITQILKMKRTPLKKVSKTNITTLRNKCDKLLTPIIIKRHPRCLLCNNPTQVAHHHVHKSKSFVLRYDFDNLINLCHSCHLALHMDESYYASKIVSIKGLNWFSGLEKRKNQILKNGSSFYEVKLKELQDLLSRTSNL